MQAEKAELTAREETENGSYAIRYAAELLGQTMEIAYFFDSTCKRLVAGSLSFAEPLSETQFLMIIRTFTNIYGEGPPSTSLNGGHILKWQNDESEIQFLHLPHGVEVPELDHLPRSLVSYRYLESNPPSCDIGND